MSPDGIRCSSAMSATVPARCLRSRRSRYWAESRVAAELQTCKPADVPASRDEVRQYFADVRERLCTSEHADRAMHYLL